MTDVRYGRDYPHNYSEESSTSTIPTHSSNDPYLITVHDPPPTAKRVDRGWLRKREKERLARRRKNKAARAARRRG